MVAPSACVDVQQFVLSVAGIQFIFQLHQPVIVDRTQETFGQLFQQRELNCLHARAGPAEFWRVLAIPPHDHAPDRAALLEKGAIGELLSAIARDQVLNHHFIGPNLRRRPLEEFPQFRPVVCSPTLCLSCINEVLLDRWLECEGRICRDLLQLVDVAGMPGLRRGNPQLIR